MKTLNTLFTVAKDSKGLRQSILTIGGDFLSAGMSAVALIVISRLLGPTHFGEFSIGVSLVFILARLCDAGFSSAIVKFAGENQDKKYLNTLFSLTLYYKTGLCLIFAVIGVMFRSHITALLGFGNEQLVMLAFILGPALVFFEQMAAMLQALHLFSRGVIMNLLQASAKMITALAFLFLNMTSAIWTFVAYLLSILLPVAAFRWLLPSWVALETKIPADVHQKVLSMVRHSSIAFIVAGLIDNIDVLFISRYLSTYEVGLYGGVMRIAMILSIAALSLGNVLFSRAARYKSVQDRRAFISKALLISVAAIGGFLCFLPFARLLIVLSIGPEYLAGVPVLIILCAAAFLLLAATPWMALFYSYKSNWYFSVSGIVQLVILIVGNSVFLPTYGVIATASIRLVTRLFLLVFSIGVALWLYQKETRAQALK